ncbi:HupE/UreJ family protein [Amaricoccus solimangrovi]|uniref:HupE/UreJ family protein n=1 Tax=Amaricoccus solimangrovi TaxID=2589815 RepID=A0A501WLK2_9RHOB|nr:HupE/UreJ family protein [Amaricoccus solimangrovi]TPE49662.1 HupE/UreJ family protein [Amaricoccus solimangrovi]
MIRRDLVAAVLTLLIPLSWAGQVSAHDVRPAYLQIDPTGPEQYTLIWRTPVLSGAPLPVVLSLPEAAETISPPRVQALPGSRVERQMIALPGGLAGERIAFVGLEATITDVLVRIGDGDGGYATELVRPSSPWIELDPDRGALAIAIAIAMTYLRQGIDHILSGIDHLLFVLALLLIVRDWRMLVKTVTAFTVAHSITLALATFGLFRLPPGPVEVLIAASIMLVAVEAVRRERGRTSIAIEWPWVVAFAFGLLHGFGFAGALQDLGLPQGDVPLALLMFNVGVEAGQMVFITVVLTALAALNRLYTIPRYATLVSSYAIGIVAAFWTIERLQSAFT